MTYLELLNGIGNNEYGTAGASMKHFILACNLIDWLEDNITDEKNFSCLEKDTLKYLVDLKPGKYAYFLNSFNDIHEIAEKIIVNPREIKDLAESCGNPLLHNSPSLNKLDAFNKFMQLCEQQIIKDEIKLTSLEMGNGPDFVQQQFEIKKKQTD